MRTLVGIPFFNEKKNLNKLISELPNAFGQQGVDMVFFDDGSNDGSVELLLSKGFNVVESSSNTGYGDTVKRVCGYAVKNEYEFFVIFPGDFQRSFEDLDRVIGVDKKYPLVITSKLRSKKIPFMRKWGNYFFSFLFSIIFKIRPIDVLSGFKRYKTTTFQSWINQLPGRYPFDLCIVFVALSKNIPVSKITVDVNYENQTTKMTRSVPVEGLSLLVNLMLFIIKYYKNKDKFL